MAMAERRYRGPEDAVRTGLPRKPMQDLYYELMRGSWRHLILLFVVTYVGANLLFGLIYWLDERSLTEGHAASYWDAFFFSVQTLSTIGYGSISPASQLADVVVTIESMVGILGVAVGTGLIFTKFSRTTAGVMFSDQIVINVRNGYPCLMLRVANSRGNEVLEASLRLAVLLNETTLEGNKMRRVIDLDLVRNNSPVFTLSWQVMHEITEDSPLYGFDLERMMEERSIFIVTLTGIDSTFSETVHARKMYTDLDVRVGEHFIDVIDFASDVLTIDLSKFHDTRPDDMWPKEQAAFLAVK